MASTRKNVEASGVGVTNCHVHLAPLLVATTGNILETPY